jgi:hypothetical protein
VLSGRSFGDGIAFQQYKKKEKKRRKKKNEEKRKTKKNNTHRNKTNKYTHTHTQELDLGTIECSILFPSKFFCFLIENQLDGD